MPDWVQAGYDDYARRLPRDSRLELTAVAASDRRNGKGAVHWQEEEAERLLAAAGDARLIALDERGRNFTTLQLSERLQEWRMDGRDVAFLIGGADGLSRRCRSAAEVSWSLSSLTLPHALVRVVLAEQIYRAWTLVVGHPYHR